MKPEIVLPSLPISGTLPRLAEVLCRHDTAILEAPPGAGKTTLVPLHLLNSSWLKKRKILMLEPRRLAARAAAQRMASLLGEKAGESVGYRTRFDTVVSDATRVDVLTEGILARMLQNDPELPGTGLLIFDEFHERHLATDLSLALALDARATLRPDLKILLMSATLDGKALSAFLDDAPVISSPGKSHPVEIEYLARDSTQWIAETAAAGVLRAIHEEGDILVFLPGAGEIRRVLDILRESAALDKCSLLPLYGDLSRDGQDRALRPDSAGRRRIILSTSIAESSLTIEGVRIVVDTGWTRRSVFDPATGMSGLQTVRVARDSADQRAGRAGRQGPGICYRLWSESTNFGLPKRSTPEILSADLAPLALQLAAWGSRNPSDLRWLDPPPQAPMSAARALLLLLNAIDDRGLITELGKKMAELPVHPRLAHMIGRARALGMISSACDIAAILDERDILKDRARENPDLRVRLDALRNFRHDKSQRDTDGTACRRAERTASQLRRSLRASTDPVDGDAGLLLALAYPDRIAWRRGATDRPGGSQRFLLSQGQGAILPGLDPFRGESLLVAARLDAGQGEGRIHLASPVAEETLRRHLPQLFQDVSVVGWKEERSCVIAETEERLGAVILRKKSSEAVDEEQASLILVDVIRRSGLSILPWTDEISDWRRRVHFLGFHIPEESWPDLSDEALLTTLEDWLLPYLTGARSRRDIDRLDLKLILSALLPRPLARRVEDDAPEHLTVPSGSRIRLKYSGTESPVLAVKLQEMFGLAETPRVARGRVPVVLHLLSPAGRPIQVTSDLRNFWNNTYNEVRKELKGRYPKHPWPEDPWNEPPTRRAKRSAGAAPKERPPGARREK